MRKRFSRTQTRVVAVLALYCVGICAILGESAFADNSIILTNASQVHSLAKTEAARHLPVRLQGVVIGGDQPEGSGFAVQDATGGIYVESSHEATAQLHSGDLVEIDGVSDPGEFAPFVAAGNVRVTGKGELPLPRRVTYEEMASGTPDAQWVEVRGIVRYSEPSPNDPRKFRIDLATGGGRLTVRLMMMPNQSAQLVDAEVCLRGVCYYLVNRNRQVLSPLLAIPIGVPVITEVPSRPDPFAAPVRSVSSLMQFAPEGSSGHRVHVRGVVIRLEPGQSLWIRDEDCGLCAQIRQTDSLQPGDVVDVLGFPKQGEYSPLLEDAVFQKSSSTGFPPAALHLVKAKEAFDHDADLVELEATLQAGELVAGGWDFTLKAADGTKFDALLPAREGQEAPARFIPASVVRVAGVCSVFREHTGFASGLSHPRTFQLLLRSAADLSVIRPPPWWDVQRITELLMGIAGVSLLAIAGVLISARWRLREQIAQQARAENEFAAILGERNRVAREIHDILAQGLSAIVLHLDLAKDESHRVSGRAARHLQIALDVARNSMADAGNAVWNLRSQVLEKNDLPEALESVLQQLTDGTGVGARFELLGQARRLPPATENAILRIGQEAITNATKHAQAQHLEVKLNFSGKTVTLDVRDDGRGFDPGLGPPRAGAFGLVGMRERAAESGGDLQICGGPGEGAEIRLTVPVAS